MARRYVTVDGKEYPIKMTMGALIRFEQETGKPFSSEKLSTSDVATIMWCCLKSACNHDKVEFDIPSEEFVDYVDVQEADAIVKFLFTDSVHADKKEDAEKK